MEILINDCVKNVNQRLFGDDDNTLKFEYENISTEKMEKYVSYIHKWNGVSSANTPTTYKQYETKARNWLNGRRAKKYSDSLFVDMIQSSLNV